jgi:hypothetical protein
MTSVPVKLSSQLLQHNCTQFNSSFKFLFSRSTDLQISNKHRIDCLARHVCPRHHNPLAHPRLIYHASPDATANHTIADTSTITIPVAVSVAGLRHSTQSLYFQHTMDALLDTVLDQLGTNIHIIPRAPAPRVAKPGAQGRSN